MKQLKLKKHCKKISILSIFLISSFAISSFIGSEDVVVEVNPIDKIDGKEVLATSGKYEIFTIHIDDDGVGGNGTWDSLSSKDWLKGSGTWEDPYIIENVTINGGGVNYGIRIDNSNNKYFIIRNCSIKNCIQAVENGAAIKLYRSSNGTIIGNNCSSNYGHGIFILTNSNNNTIAKNVITFNGNDGIQIDEGSKQNTVKLNNISWNTADGIDIQAFSVNNKVFSNNISNNDVSNDKDGICFSFNSGDNHLENNTLIGNRIYSLNSDNNIILNNSIKILSENAIEVSGGDYTIIQSNTIYNTGGYDGIYLVDSPHTTILNNDVIKTGNGIYLYSSSGNCNNCTILGNTIMNSTSRSLYIHSSDGIKILNNTSGYTKGSGMGSFTFQNSDFNKIMRNKIYNSSEYGIWLTGGSGNNLFKNNTITNTTTIGMNLGNDCDLNTFTLNIIKNCRLRGFYIGSSSSTDNLIYKNYFTENKLHAKDVSAIDSNHWNSSYVGNYWDNLTGVDNNLDGICDDQNYIYIQGGITYGAKTDYLPIYGNPLYNGRELHIDDNNASSYNWQWHSTRFWCNGEGTEDYPYILENLDVIPGSKGVGIIIANSSAHFVIQNCDLSEEESTGLKMINTQNGIVRNTTFFDNNNGLYTKFCRDLLIEGCLFDQNTNYGLEIQSTNETIIRNNTIKKNQDNGLYIRLSNHTLITNNSIYQNSGAGVYVNYDKFINVTNNDVFENDEQGIIFYFYTENSNIFNNRIYKNKFSGIELQDSTDNNASFNEVYNNDQYGILLIRSFNNPVRNYLHNNTIVYNNYSGIKFHHRVSYCKVIGNNISFNGKKGADDSDQSGIFFLGEDPPTPYHWNRNNSIEWNYIANNTAHGIFFFEYAYFNNITNNVIEKNGKIGVYINSAELNLVKKNIIRLNQEHGIKINATSFSNNITQNTIQSNNLDGILLDSADENIIHNNTISNNLRIGLNLTDQSDGNIAIRNHFVDNIQGNAIDLASNSKWNNTEIGNLWSDYGGKDADDDGIGDTNYDIDSNSIDHKPIFWDAPKFSINSPENESTHVNPPTFELNIEEGVKDTSWWVLDGESIKHKFEGTVYTMSSTDWAIIEYGDITLRFFINDSRGYMDCHVINLIKQASAPSSTEPDDEETDEEIKLYWVLNPFIIDDSGKGDFTWMQAVNQPWCSGKGTNDDPYVIENLSITFNHAPKSYCILIRNSQASFVLQNCNFTGSSVLETSQIDFKLSAESPEIAAIYLFNITNGLIKNNNCSLSYYGIRLVNCDKNIISNNIIQANQIGIYLNNSNQNIVQANTFSNNIEALIEEDNCAGNSIINNLGYDHPVEPDGFDIIGFVLSPLGIIILAIIGAGTTSALVMVKKRGKQSEKKTSEQNLKTPEIKAPVKKKDKLEIAHKEKKLKKTTTDEKKEGLSNEELQDLEKTEKEVDIDEQKIICVVHKGEITGANYICPKCKTYYCWKCANALKEKGEGCWTCEAEIKFE